MSFFGIPCNHENIATHVTGVGPSGGKQAGVLLRRSVADPRAHLSLCGFPFSEDHDRDLSIPRVAYREVLPDSPALSPLPMLQHSGLSSQKGDTSSDPRSPAHAGPTVTTVVVNPSLPGPGSS